MMDSDVRFSGNVSSGDPNAALRTVIQLTFRTDLRRILGGCPIEQCGLRENLRTIVAHARRHQMPAEQLLSLIKEVNATLPEAMELRARAGTAGALGLLISMAADEFYGLSQPPI
jgi:hypothetical protein